VRATEAGRAPPPISGVARPHGQVKENSSRKRHSTHSVAAVSLAGCARAGLLSVGRMAPPISYHRPNDASWRIKGARNGRIFLDCRRASTADPLMYQGRPRTLHSGPNATTIRPWIEGRVAPSIIRGSYWRGARGWKG